MRKALNISYFGKYPEVLKMIESVLCVSISTTRDEALHLSLLTLTARLPSVPWETLAFIGSNALPVFTAAFTLSWENMERMSLTVTVADLEGDIASHSIYKHWGITSN